MRIQIVEGKEVKLRSAQGEISRIAVKVLDDVVHICRRDEYERALGEGREPVTIGFRVTDVIA